MTGMTVLGIIAVLLLIVCVGLYSGSRVRNSKDFITGGGTSGSLMVCGAIMGSLVSSQATIGTAQLAFHYGMAAWWFTLGSGIGCLVLALFYAKSLRHSGCVTELQIIAGEYGSAARSFGSVLSSTGTFFSVLAQVVAATGLLTVLFPSMPAAAAALASVAVMCLYVIFGGAFSAGMGGMLKMLLLCLAGITGCVVSLALSGGLSGLTGQLETLLIGTDLGLIQEETGLNNILTAQDVANRYYHLTARGTMKDIGSGISLMLGVLSTQTYAQAVLSAKTDVTAKRGALLGVLLVPLLGVAGILTGMFMRTQFITQAEADALIAAGKDIGNIPVIQGTIQVFPVFAITYLPPLAAGFILGTLLLTAVGGGAGLSLGIATVIVKDIVRKAAEGRELLITRLAIAGVLCIAAVTAIVLPGSTINDFGFLSMGLRGTVIFMPLSCALWLKGRVHPRFVLASMILGPLTVILFKLFFTGVDSLIPGVLVSVVCCLFGIICNSFKRRKEI